MLLRRRYAPQRPPDSPPAYADQTRSVCLMEEPVPRLILNFESDNPFNTTLRDDLGNVAYVLSTNFGKHPVSRVHDYTGVRLAEWTWRDIRGDVLSYKDTPPRAARSWLKGSATSKGGAKFVDDEGSEFAWYQCATNRTVELRDKRTGASIARFERSFRDFRSIPGVHIQVPAQIIFADTRTTAARDAAVVAFFLQERKRRQEDSGPGWGHGSLGAGAI